MNTIIFSILTLLVISGISSVILFFISRKFQVFEDQNIQKIESVLPAANCGGCGYPSCHGFALACVNAENLENLVCTVGGLPTMKKVAHILGKDSNIIHPTVAVIRCGGNCDLRPRINQYDGVGSCVIAHNLYGGETGCAWGCLGLGDCEVSCKFDALHINPETRLPEIDEEKCTSCNACVIACPKLIIELRNKGLKSRRIFVNCVNKDKDEEIQSSCNVACIGCGKCVEECAFDAILMANNLAYIDSNKCTLCRKCVAVCPTHAILEINFPTKREKE